MAIKYYKKLTPETKPVLSNNTRLDFTTLDGLVGYFATDQQYVQAEIERFMAEGRYAISEIEPAEFARDYIEQKKNPNLKPLKPVWREEIGAGSKAENRTLLHQVGAEKVAAVVGLVAKPSEEKTIPTPKVETPKEDFKPSVGQRKKRPEQTK